MGCLINYAARDGLLRAEVWGKSSLHEAAWIARDIVEQTVQQAARHVLIDVRRLADRLGKLGMLSMVLVDPAELSGYRVAIVDIQEHDAFYARHEAKARDRGYALRCFTSAEDAKSWLLNSDG